MSRLNLPLLRRLKTRFMRMRHPEHFNMAVWAHKNECGTAMCIAGHILDLQGYKLRLKRFESFTGNLKFIAPNGEEVDDVAGTAASEIGIPRDAAFKLFQNNGTIATPKEAAARIQQLIDTAPTKTAKGKGR